MPPSTVFLISILIVGSLFIGVLLAFTPIPLGISSTQGPVPSAGPATESPIKYEVKMANNQTFYAVSYGHLVEFMSSHSQEKVITLSPAQTRNSYNIIVMEKVITPLTTEKVE